MLTSFKTFITFSSFSFRFFPPRGEIRFSAAAFGRAQRKIGSPFDGARRKASLFDILNLFADFFQLGFHVERQARDGEVGGF